MIQNLTRRVTRAVEVLLPKATADAGCTPEQWMEYKDIGGTCFGRVCSLNGACVKHCGIWYSTSGNNC